MTENDSLFKEQIKNLTDAVKELKDTVKELRDDLKDDFVSKEIYNTLKDEVNSLKNSRTWIICLIVGSIFAGIVKELIGA